MNCQIGVGGSRTHPVLPATPQSQPSPSSLVFPDNESAHLTNAPGMVYAPGLMGTDRNGFVAFPGLVFDRTSVGSDVDAARRAYREIAGLVRTSADTPPCR